jgi:hypothetical protein
MKNAGMTVEEKVRVATDQSATYSIAQAAKRLKRSESMTKKYKGTLLGAWKIHTDLIVTKAGSLTEEGLRELSIVQTHYKGGNPDGYAFDLYKRRHDLFADLASDLANDQVIDAEIEEDFIPDGAETAEQTALVLGSETRALGNITGVFNNHLDSARGRLYSMIRAELDPVATQAVRDSLASAVGVLEGVGTPENPTQG